MTKVFVTADYETKAGATVKADAAEAAANVYTDSVNAADGLTAVPWSNGSIVTTWNPHQVGATSGGHTANELVLCRVIIPKTGNLRDLSIFSIVASGNIEVAVYDTQSTIALLYGSGSVASVGTNAWQIVGDPNLAVTKGQHIYLGIGADNNTFRRSSVNGNMSAAAVGRMPFSLGGLGSGTRTFCRALSSFPAPATIADGSLTDLPGGFPLIIGRIS